VVVSVGCLSSCLGYLLLAVSSLSWGGDWPLYLSSVLQLNSVTTVAIRYNQPPTPHQDKEIPSNAHISTLFFSENSVFL
jgi:hypothetical protein